MSYGLQQGTRARFLAARYGAATKDFTVGIIVVPCTHEPRESTVDQLKFWAYSPFEAKSASEGPSVFRREKHHGHQVSESGF